MLVDCNFYAVSVACSAFTARARAPHEHAATVAQLAIKRFHNASSGFARDVGVGRLRLRVRPLGFGKVARVAVVAAGQCLTQAPQHVRAPQVQSPGHDGPTGALYGQPRPDFVLLAAHKGPHFIDFERLPIPTLRLFRPQPGERRHWQLRFFLPAWQMLSVNHNPK
jgi:hypothetical protein